MSEAARIAFEADAERRYASIHLRTTRTDGGYINPVWNGEWLLWQRAWNAGVAAALGMEVINDTPGVKLPDGAQQ